MGNATSIRLLVIPLAFALFTHVPAAIPQDQTAPNPASLTLDEKEEFLQNGKVIGEKFISIGITRPIRATLEYKGMTHYAHVQSIDETMTPSEAGQPENQQRDYYGYNIAAYQLDKLLGLNMTPPSVKRKYKAKSAAVTWWVDNVAMMYLDLIHNKMTPPDLADWNRQIFIVRIMNQLLCDADPNMSNVLITKDWKIWTVDRTRAFRTSTKLQTNTLSRCDRHLLARLKELTKDQLHEKLGDYLTRTEIESLDIRRQALVNFFENEIAQKGEGAVLYDLHPQTGETH